MSLTKWWKCDLQVATPAWNFEYPPCSNYRLKDADPAVVAAEKVRFLDDYMQALKAKGIEVVALADHNTGAWIDDAKAAGERHGVIVFPGVEITTQTGADGVHLLIVGDRSKTSLDFDRLIHAELGFNADNPPHRMEGANKVPGSSGKTLVQILDALPHGYLALAPHVLSENGLASQATVQGDIRWKALHHDRLVAIDPGDCSDPQGQGFNARFRRRELTSFPCLPFMAFMATSDAYSMENLGQRFTWIRMGEPTIEALRQACLDHESRMLCDWSLMLASFPERNPNNVRHAWIDSVSLAGTLTNSTAPLTLHFHPGLNVIIGGRGSGKSSVVAALRQLYSSSETLPGRLRDEAEEFAATVFGEAQLGASHHVQESQLRQQVVWTKANGSMAQIDGQQMPNDLHATVISQKELFERAAGDKNDPHLTSRSLLTLVDSSLEGGVAQNLGTTVGGPTLNSHGRKMSDARVLWASEHRAFVQLKNDLVQLPALRSRAATLEGQVEAFSAPAVKERLARIDQRQREEANLVAGTESLKASIEEAARLSAAVSQQTMALGTDDLPVQLEYANLVAGFNQMATTLAVALKTASESAAETMGQFEHRMGESEWKADVVAAEFDLQAYKDELQAQGLSPDEFTRLQEDLTKTREAIRLLEEREPKLADAQAKSVAAWHALLELLAERRATRQALFSSIEERSKRLRFKVEPMRDTAPWVKTMRTTLTFRADGFIEDSDKLATWIWEGDTATLDTRIQAWQTFLADPDAKEFQRLTALRPQFLERIVSSDEGARLRLATVVPDDVVRMEFLRENGRPEVEADWQSVAQGSPGQRTAAMLAFVLHHGREPLILDQPEDDLDSEWISKLVVKELRQSRWHRQLIVVSHNANIPVLGDAEQVIALENQGGALCVKRTAMNLPDGSTEYIEHMGPVEAPHVRRDIQAIMEGGVPAFMRRERKYNNETREHRNV